MKLGSYSPHAAAIRLMVALFAAATVSVSACAAACLQVHCIEPVSRAAHEHSGHAGHSSAPRDNPPSGDCAQHGHPGSYIKERDDSSGDAPTLLATGVAPEDALRATLPAAPAPDRPKGCDHASASVIPRYEFDCSLRI